MGSVAPPWERHLGKRRYLWRAPPGSLRGRGRLGSSCRTTTGLQGADGVGLRAYREPAVGDTHACELLSQHVHPRSCGRSWGDVRVVPLSCCPRIGRCDVGRRWCARPSQPRASLPTATAAPVAGWLENGLALTLSRREQARKERPHIAPVRWTDAYRCWTGAARNCGELR